MTKTDKIEYLPNAAQLPANLALVYVGDFVPEIEDEVLGRIQSHDVVLVARGRELASYMAKRLNDHKHGRWVVDYVEGTARERYLTWLGVLAARHPRAEVLWMVMGIFPARGPQCGEPFFMLDKIALAEMLEMAPRVFKKDARGLPLEYDGRPAELLLEVPLDDFSGWVKGEHHRSGFDVPAEHGTIRVALEKADTERRLAYLRVCRRETGEHVAATHLLVDGVEGAAVDYDVLDALKPFPDETAVILRKPSYSDDAEPSGLRPKPDTQQLRTDVRRLLNGNGRGAS